MNAGGDLRVIGATPEPIYVRQPHGPEPVFVGLLHVFKPVALANIDVHIALEHHIKQIVGHGLDFEDVQPAESGDLFKTKRGIVNQPGGGCVRHERLDHGEIPQKQ